MIDEISRIIASPLPRRQALRLLGGVVGGGVLASLGLGRASRAFAQGCATGQFQCGGGCYPHYYATLYTCCGGILCPNATMQCCGNATTGTCCASSGTCYGTGSSLCCAAGRAVCGSHCCGSGIACNTDTKACCTTAKPKYCGGTACYAADYACCGTKACPPGHWCCAGKCYTTKPSGVAGCVHNTA